MNMMCNTGPITSRHAPYWWLAKSVFFWCSVPLSTVLLGNHLLHFFVLWKSLFMCTFLPHLINILHPSWIKWYIYIKKREWHLTFKQQCTVFPEWNTSLLHSVEYAMYWHTCLIVITCLLFDNNISNIMHSIQYWIISLHLHPDENNLLN